jgi:hypothetical protein
VHIQAVLLGFQWFPRFFVSGNFRVSPRDPREAKHPLPVSSFQTI